MNIHYLLRSISYSVMITAMVGCKSTQTPSTTQPETAQLLSEYLQSSFDRSDLPAVPSSMYKVKVQPSKIADEREQLLDIWRSANANAIAQSGFLNPIKDSVYVWPIPQDERMPIRLFTKGDRPAKGYPLFINLHGGGKNPYAKSAWDSPSNDNEWKAALILGHRYADAPSLYVVPRMADDRKGRWYLSPQRTAFKRAIRLAIASGLVDPDRIYLLGISEGGYGSHRLGLFMPDYFTAVGPMAAAEPPGSYEQNLRNLPFRLEVGEYDNGFGRNEFAGIWKHKLDSLAQHNPNEFIHEVNIQPGKGHGINYYKVAPWLAGFTHRNVYPDHITYEYYNLMDGYPTGVYYIGFQGVKRVGECALLFDVRHQGNTYTVTTKPHKGTVSGSITLYLDHIDFTQPVRVIMNGHQVYDEKVTPNIGTMIESLALFADPLRVFPAKIDLKL